jgi:hypothetical protein
MADMLWLSSAAKEPTAVVVVVEWSLGALFLYVG